MLGRRVPQTIRSRAASAVHRAAGTSQPVARVSSSGISGTPCSSRKRSAAASSVAASTHRPTRQRLAQRLHHLASPERRRAPRQPVRPGKSLAIAAQSLLADGNCPPAPDQPPELRPAEPELLRPRRHSPTSCSAVTRGSFDPPRRQRRRLRRPRPGRPALGERRIDLRPPPAERPHHGPRHADDLGDPTPHRRPLDADRPRQLAAQHRLVDEARRPRLRVQPPPIERRPPPVDRHARGSRPRRACAAADRRPATSDAGTPPPPARTPPQRSRRRARAEPRPPTAPVPDRLTDRDVVRRTNAPAQLVVAEPEQHAHALRRARTSDRSRRLARGSTTSAAPSRPAGRAHRARAAARPPPTSPRRPSSRAAEPIHRPRASLGPT